MYVYYERWFFPDKQGRGKSIYVHQITVHENCTQSLFDKLRKTPWKHKVSGKVGGKVYVRVLARRIRFSHYVTYRRKELVHNARVDNFLLNYSIEKDYAMESES
ncbi:MAG: hypothetical protein [Caudoviricetes sp.]|nr:MAG: hypothetical protein [Caudoviricetes sp.]